MNSAEMPFNKQLLFNNKGKNDMMDSIRKISLRKDTRIFYLIRDIRISRVNFTLVELGHMNLTQSIIMVLEM